MYGAGEQVVVNARLRHTGDARDVGRGEPAGEDCLDPVDP
jgi:hypothetical protein